MSELEVTAADAEQLYSQLDDLKAKNFHTLYPARYYHIDSLLQRAKNSEPALKSLLATKASSAIKELSVLKPHPKDQHYSSDKNNSPLLKLTKSLQKKSNKALKRKQNSGFDNLIQQQEISFFHAASNSEAENQSVVEAYKDSIAQMNTKKFIQQVINEVPKDPGPLNAHKLVIKTLTSMQAISPSYLRRIVNQIDTMFYLNEAGSSKKSKGK